MLVWMTWRKAAEVLGVTEREVRRRAYLEMWEYTDRGVEVRVTELAETIRLLAA